MVVILRFKRSLCFVQSLRYRASPLTSPQEKKEKGLSTYPAHVLLSHTPVSQREQCNRNRRQQNELAWYPTLKVNAVATTTSTRSNHARRVKKKHTHTQVQIPPLRFFLPRHSSMQIKCKKQMAKKEVGKTAAGDGNPSKND